MRLKPLRNLTVLLVALRLLGFASAQAEEQSVTTAEKRPPGGSFSTEAIGIIPQAGILAFSDSNGNTDSRGVAGLTIDMNALRGFSRASSGPFFGPTVGILYSHLGMQSSNFLGFNSATGDTTGTHLLLLPLNIKAGYTIAGVFRPSAHAGATVAYNNLQSTATGTQINNSSTSLYPNLGVDIEWAVGRTVGLLFRPDWVFTSNTALFSGTFGLTIPMS